MKLVLKIEGMSCQNCVAHVTKALKSISGVEDAIVDLGEGSAKVSGSNLNGQALIEAVEEEGYEAEVA
ncbi:MAG: heavy metal-binding protein [Armatimonadetes bacterium]|nr:heavy metal-binding protein [Armatimonadota bacterium]